MANAICHHHETTEQFWGLSVVPEYDDTLVVYIIYSKQFIRDPKMMNKSIETCHEVINMLSKKYGWQNWVKIRDDVHEE